jgi:5-methyltetrahydropteroyltriglutamate--homocysteine methyltransferase
MLRSDGRILTTHAGSLPRSKRLIELMVAVSKREAVDAAELAREIEEGRRRSVRAQLACGIDIGNDGEQGRESFFTYLQHRLSGFGGEGQRPIPRDITQFESFLTLKLPDFQRTMVSLVQVPKVMGDVQHLGIASIGAECRAFQTIVDEHEAGFAETFLTAASPGIVAAAIPNERYASHDEYVVAVAEALRPEYGHIVEQGFVLQVDCPDFAMERHVLFADRPLEDFLRFVETNVAALNRAIEGLPRDRVRVHACWGNYEAPHHLDVAMEAILPLIYQAQAGAIFLPFANPRHQHEWRCLEQLPLPEHMLVIAGIIDTTTNYVEHPEVVAERIERVANAVGDPSRVLAGTDCGFDTSAGLGMVAQQVVWEKLRSLRAGAELASKRLFG